MNCPHNRQWWLLNPLPCAEPECSEGTPKGIIEMTAKVSPWESRGMYYHRSKDEQEQWFWRRGARP